MSPGRPQGNGFRADHKKVAKGALRNLIRAAGLTAEAFVAATKKVQG